MMLDSLIISTSTFYASLVWQLSVLIRKIISCIISHCFKMGICDCLQIKRLHVNGKAQEHNYVGTRFKTDNIISNGCMSRYKWYQSLYPIGSVAIEDVGL